MRFEIAGISGLGEYQLREEQDRAIYTKSGRAFLVANKNTIEVRCDARLANNLREKYESVMGSRYFGRGGIEVVLSGQLSQDELEDLVRLSYNLTNDSERHN